MQINITARDFGGTEFLAQPHRLHLGAQKAEGVDQLEFSLPEQWNGCVVTLHIRHADGTLAEPLALDEAGCVGVGRSFTGWASGEWMLAAANGNGYTAYTRPGQYDVHGILPTEGGGEELTPSVYEQFIARVVDSANAAAEAAKRAASGEANAKQSASEAAVSAQQTAASATLAAGYAEQAAGLNDGGDGHAEQQAAQGAAGHGGQNALQLTAGGLFQSFPHQVHAIQKHGNAAHQGEHIKNGHPVLHIHSLFCFHYTAFYYNVCAQSTPPRQSKCYVKFV